MTRLTTAAIGSRARWAAMTIGQQGMAGASSLVFLVASSTTLTLGDRGTLALATSAAAIAGTLAPLGMTHALLHFGGRGFAPSIVVRLFVRELLVATAVAVFAATIVFRLLTGADPIMTIACGVAIAAYALLQVTQAALYGLAEVRVASLRRSIGSASLLLAALCLTLADVDQPAVWLSAWIAAVVTSACLQLLALRSRPLRPAGPRDLTNRDVRSFCWKAAPLNLSYILAGRIDLWIVGAFLDMESVAIYSAALGVVELASVFGQGLASSFQINAARTHRPPIHLFGLLAVGQTAVALVGWAIVAWVTAGLFGNDADYRYGALGLPLAILAVSSGPLAFQRVYGAWMAGAGAASETVGSTVLMAGAVGLLAWSLVPALGITGAALASLLGYTLGAVTLLLADRTNRSPSHASAGT